MDLYALQRKVLVEELNQRSMAREMDLARGKEQRYRATPGWSSNSAAARV